MEVMALHCYGMYLNTPLRHLSTRPSSKVLMPPQSAPSFSSRISSAGNSITKSTKFTPWITATRRKGIPVVAAAAGVPLPPLDLTEDNVQKVLVDTRTEFAHVFDDSVGITGVVELAELDGPFVKIRLKGRFWHERSIVLARIGNYLKQRIPEILEVDIEDEKQLDDSPANF